MMIKGFSNACSGAGMNRRGNMKKDKICLIMA